MEDPRGKVRGGDGSSSVSVHTAGTQKQGGSDGPEGRKSWRMEGLRAPRMSQTGKGL